MVLMLLKFTSKFDEEIFPVSPCPISLNDPNELPRRASLNMALKIDDASNGLRMIRISVVATALEKTHKRIATKGSSACP